MTDGTTGVQQIHIREVVEPLDETPFWAVLEVRVLSCIDGGIDCKVAVFWRKCIVCVFRMPQYSLGISLTSDC